MALELDLQPSTATANSVGPGSETLVIGVINNMPDSALEGTETQFQGLLAAAAGDRSLRLRYSSLPEVPRGPAARARIAARYWPLAMLLADAPDALIVTGTEPKSPSLRDEPYWGRLAEVVEFARTRVLASAWSCLAAHAAVLHLDGIERRRLPAKRFGVFSQRVMKAHGLTNGLDSTIAIPHSRCNDIPLAALAAAGYEVLTQSPAGEADLFVKPGGRLMVFFQGHPEYEPRTLLKEYQRDVSRYITGEYRDYPQAPPGYFNAAACAALDQFERRLRSGGFADPISAFPFSELAASLHSGWAQPAAAIYRNWLDYVAQRKADASGARNDHHEVCHPTRGARV
jgi:homoserine O-succinyltransferase